MTFQRKARAAVALVVLAAGLGLSACGSSGKSAGGSGPTTITYLVDNSDNSVKMANALVAAFEAANPNIKVTVDTRPQGTDGDNAVKTKLATGDMDDVFFYNSGSLFQAMDPQRNLVPLTGEPFMANVQDSFLPTVSADGKAYGVPTGTAMGGGILYNIDVYNKLGLQVPTTWAEFMANNAKIKAAGIAPVIQTYQDTWTSQLLVLADFHNVAAIEPNFAADYTANKAHFATDPAALEGFQRLQAVKDAGYLNSDYASIKLEKGLEELAKGTGAQYPMLTFAVSTLVSTYPDAAKSVGFFAQPGDDASTNGLTTWTPAGSYIPNTTTGDKLTAAKKFLAFIASPAGCDAQTQALPPTGPYMIKGCTLPADLPQATKDLQQYFDDGKNSPALEFLSPVKGPNLENITVQVGSGISTAAQGAALYDQDVKKEAQQLGLPGW